MLQFKSKSTSNKTIQVVLKSPKNQSTNKTQKNTLRRMFGSASKDFFCSVFAFLKVYCSRIVFFFLMFRFIHSKSSKTKKTCFWFLIGFFNHKPKRTHTSFFGFGFQHPKKTHMETTKKFEAEPNIILTCFSFLVVLV